MNTLHFLSILYLYILASDSHKFLLIIVIIIVYALLALCKKKESLEDEEIEARVHERSVVRDRESLARFRARAESRERARINERAYTQTVALLAARERARHTDAFSLENINERRRDRALVIPLNEVSHAVIVSTPEIAQDATPSDSPPSYDQREFFVVASPSNLVASNVGDLPPSYEDSLQNLNNQTQNNNR